MPPEGFYCKNHCTPECSAQTGRYRYTEHPASHNEGNDNPEAHGVQLSAIQAIWHKGIIQSDNNGTGVESIQQRRKKRHNGIQTDAADDGAADENPNRPLPVGQPAVGGFLKIFRRQPDGCGQGSKNQGDAEKDTAHSAPKLQNHLCIQRSIFQIQGIPYEGAYHHVSQMGQAEHPDTDDANLDNHGIQPIFCHALFPQVIQNDDAEHQPAEQVAGGIALCEAIDDGGGLS